MIFKKSFFLLFVIFLLSACNSKFDNRLKISITNWIGYSPFLYLKEKEILNKLNIKLLEVTSLSENLYLYEANNSDAFVGTQYEYSIAKKNKPSLVPLKLLDRSDGGDMVLSTHDINELKQAKIIDAFLEIDSINLIMLEDFIKTNDLNVTKINYINKDQLNISNLNKKGLVNPSIAVTYMPYDIELIKNGFIELANTKTSSDILVIDALFTTKEKFYSHHKQFEELNKEINKAIEVLINNPKNYFETIKKYYPNTSFEDFMASCEKISWANKGLEEKYSQYLQKHDFPLRDLIK